MTLLWSVKKDVQPMLVHQATDIAICLNSASVLNTTSIALPFWDPGVGVGVATNNGKITGKALSSIINRFYYSQNIPKEKFLVVENLAQMPPSIKNQVPPKKQKSRIGREAPLTKIISKTSAVRDLPPPHIRADLAMQTMIAIPSSAVIVTFWARFVTQCPKPGRHLQPRAYSRVPGL